LVLGFSKRENTLIDDTVEPILVEHGLDSGELVAIFVE
jgi:hypothetical protein